MSDDKTYLQIAQSVSQLSNDPRTKVGAVLVTADGGVSIGYNSFPRGVKESEARWSSPQKYDFVVTAEVNAILAAQGRNLAGATLYISQDACLAASKVAVQAGISRIVCPKGGAKRGKPKAHTHDAASDSHPAAAGLLKEARVKTARV